VEATVTVAASASDNIGVSSVSFKVDGAVVSTDNSAPYSFSWNTTSVAAGVHTLAATATDAAGNLNTNSIQVTVNTVVVPPVILPASTQLLMPPVERQDGEGSCVAFATTYAARSAEQFYKTNATSYNLSTNIFSPEFIYNQIKISDCASGAGLTTALDLLTSTGVCSWQSMPYSAFNGCSLMPNSSQLSEASNFKINSYSKIPVSDVTAIKTMLVNKHPVIITVALDESFSYAQPGFIWKSYSGTPSISHTIVICGYDNSKNAYKVMNSWGTTWAEAGYSWIDYTFLTQCAFYYGYVINS
jgi:C1A family cysteine protease